MPELDDQPAVEDLLRRSQFVFEGTVTSRGTSTSTALEADDHTVVARVDLVLHAPAALAHTTNTEVTIQTVADAPAPEVGARLVFFTTALAFDTGIALEEVGRRAPDSVGGTTLAAGARATLPGARPGRAHPVLDAASDMQTAALRQHAADAGAVVVGRVVNLVRVQEPSVTEHIPEWWRATIDVEHVVKGDVGREVDVLYPNSADVHWARVPKPVAGQHGLWILHPTDGADATLAPFSLRDADDAQPADRLDLIEGDG